MDEIGRGTSTYDGLSLAWACAEALANKNKAFTLFATHYFELTTLAETHTAIGNVHLDAVEHNDEIVFMHNVKSGAASKSYGLQVAKLAGLPSTALRDARQRLQALENNTTLSAQQASTIQSPQMGLFDPQMGALKDANAALTDYIADLDPDNLSPRQALDHIYELSKLLNE